MTTPELSLVILALLLTPGPTNTLLFLAGAERGFAGALRLVPAELLGYLAVTVPLAIAGAHLLDTLPVLRPVIAVLAGLWVARLAIRLWRLPAGMEGSGATVNARAVLATTLLNPKALLFGLVLLPSPSQLALNLGVFSASIVVVAAGWAGLGAGLAATGGRGGSGVALMRRIAALWLAAISVTLIAKGLQA